MKFLKKKKIIKESGSHMFLYKNRILITGGSGRFGTELKKIKNKYKLLCPSKKKI